MDNLNIDIENISIINEFIDIDINLINSLKSTFSNKQDLYDFVYAIFSLAGMGASYCKYSTEARNLKDMLYPGLVKGVMWYYTPKMYWIIISLLENDNNLIAYILKERLLMNY